MVDDAAALIAATTVAFAAAGAAAQVPAAAAAATADTVEVQATSPALWRVTRGRSELVIVGGIAPASPDYRWSERRVKEALHGARVLLLSPQSTPGLAWAAGFNESHRYLFGQPFGRTLLSELPPAEAERFTSDARSIGLKPDPFNDHRPASAGMRLLEAAWGVLGLSPSAVFDQMKALARAAHVRVVEVDWGGALPLAEAMTVMTRPQHAVCAAEALDQLEWELAHGRQAAYAWASGDVTGLRRNYRPPTLCASSIPGGAARRAEAEVAWSRALLAALNAPGRTVALADAADLLEPSPLLAAMRARGAAVSAPPEERSPS